MNPFEMVVLIVFIVTIGRVISGRRHRRFEPEQMLDVTPTVGETNDSHRLRDEVQQLKNRIQVLERIAVEKENSLAREIDQLRDR